MEELTAKFILEEQDPMKATFKIDVAPSKISELENDMGFVTKDDVITPDFDLSDYATKEELETKQPKGNYAFKSDVPKLQLITLADYNTLATKDANTLYLIEE